MFASHKHDGGRKMNVLDTIDPIMWTYVLLATICNMLTKDKLKKKRRFILLTLAYGAGKSLWQNNYEVLLAVSVVVMCLNLCWEEECWKERRKKD